MLVEDHLGIGLPAATIGAIRQHVLVDDGDLAARCVEVVRDLASRASGLIHAGVGAAIGGDDLGQLSSENVGKVESVEDRSKLSLGDPLDWGACHMSDEIPTSALSRYLDGALDVGALAAILEAETWDVPSPVGADALRIIYEFGNGDWTERQVRDRLRRLIEPRPVGFIFGVAVSDTHFGPETIGVAIRRSSVVADQTSEQDPQFQSEPHFGIDIGETTPVQVR